MSNNDYTVHVVRNAGTANASFSTIPLSTLVDDCSANNGIGYKPGTGGVVTQLTSKSTPVTLNTLTGEITLNNASLAAATVASFTFTNSKLAAGDMVVSSHHSGGTIGAYLININVTGTNTATVTVRNETAGALAEAIVIKYAVIKTATN
jgi:hypothetical protein